MERLIRLGQANSEGIDMVAEAVGKSIYELMRLGIGKQAASSLVRLASVYFPQSRTKQPAIDAARKNQHNWETLSVIEAFVRKLPDKRQAWSMRTQLCRLRGTQMEIRKAAEAELKRRVGRVGEARIDETPRLKRVHSAKYGVGFTFYGPELEVANILNAVHAKSKTGTVEDNGAALLEVFRSGAGTTQYSAVVGITLNEAVAIEQGKGDDVHLIASDGARMTGREFIEKALLGRSFAMLVHPVEGPVNLYSARFASAKQRTMLSALWPHCEDPNCRVPADRCQVHHITAFKHGGQTNINNLAMLCKYHNGINDDHLSAVDMEYRTPKSRGRIEHRGLRAYRRLPSGTLIDDPTPGMAKRLLRERQYF